LSTKCKPTLIRKTDSGITWVDIANLALLCLDAPIPSNSTDTYMAQWRSLSATEKAAEAARLLTPHFTLNELVTKTRVATKARASELLEQHVDELQGAVVPLNVGTDDKPKLIAAARGHVGACRFLELLNEHRTAGHKNAAPRIRVLTDELQMVCNERTTPANIAALVERIDYLTELQGFAARLAAHAHQQLAIQGARANQGAP
jgi:hypothetical protein